RCADNEVLGKLVIPIKRKTAKGEPGLEVHLRLDDDGMLYAKAWDVESGEQTNIKIEHNETPRIFPETLSDVEIDDLDGDSDTKKIDDISDYDDNKAIEEDDAVNNFSFGDEFNDDDNQNFDDNNYDDNYDENADNNYAGTTYNTEYKEEKNSSTLKGILIGVIIFLLLVLIVLGIICGMKACSNSEQQPKPKKPKTTIQNTTTTYEDFIEEEPTTTTVAVTTTTTVRPAPVYEPQTTGVKQLNGKKHFIRRGDNLWNICKRYYGDPWYYPDLAKYNNLRSPRFIIAGQNLIIPDKSELKRWDFSK
ncbi:MAG: LysM peptidoglycan-binding domain-containing protein, partial [Spirochaetales bacterium]|nr:LysM peptidoglycan-binding domain-containing protein [Spirochaetales bacterium]